MLSERYSEPDERILYVDDERDAREAFASAAHQLGFRVDTADGGGEALNMASRKRYAVVAADLRMPALNGLSLIQLLRPKWPDTTYLIVTGATHLALPAQSNGAPLVDEIVAKPWSLGNLADTLRRALDRHRERRSDVYSEAVEIPLLLLDDDDSSASRFEEMLSCGPQVPELVRASTLEHAVELVSARSFRVALVDFELTKRGGIQRLRRADPRIALVVLGDLEDEALRSRIEKAGAHEYLVKQHAEGYALRQSIRYAIERRLIEERLQYLSRHDPVTGLANRDLFRERVTEAIHRARRGRARLGVLLLDLDRFKTVNDSLGHDIGDRLLKVVAQRLVENVREHDTVARFGGDEFAVLVDRFAEDKEIVATAQRLLEALVPPASLHEYEIGATASIGIALFPEHGETAGELLQRADRAMCRAKQNGRDGYELYDDVDEESRSGVLERLRFESGIRYALERNEYAVFYQPQMTLDRSSIVALEALIRWKHPKVGFVPPARFMPYLESSGLIKGVGEWVLETACREVKGLHRQGHAELRLSVNLSARQFDGVDLTGIVERVLSQTDFPATALELEITESLLMRDIERTRRTLEGLKGLGVRIAIDDFGTGYSSLAYLTKFPLDCLKIDRSFVSDITTDAEDRAVAQAIIGLGHTLGLDVVAEGVETEEQLALLEGCEGFQGYLISRPKPLEELRDLFSVP